MSRSKTSWAAACAAAFGLALSDGQAVANASCRNAGWVVVEAKASPQTRAVKIAPKDRIFVRKDQITTTADLTEIKLAGDEHDTQIQMTFTPEAAKRLHDATTNRSGIRIAFVTDDEVISAVTWTAPTAWTRSTASRSASADPCRRHGPSSRPSRSASALKRGRWNRRDRPRASRSAPSSLSDQLPA